MLVLINEIIVEIESPEVHASLFWHRVLSQDPKSTLASAILEDVRTFCFEKLSNNGDTPQDIGLIRDIAAILVTYTGANVAFFPTNLSGGSVRITHVADEILQMLHSQCARGRKLNVDKFWKKAA